MKCNINKCVKNIREIIKTQGKKIGDIESKAGFSQGYLSKILKNPKQETLSISFIEKISELLNVSIDLIMYYDYSKIEEDEKIAIEFLKEIREKTINKELHWKSVYTEKNDLFEYIKAMPIVLQNKVKTEYEFKSKYKDEELILKRKIYKEKNVTKLEIIKDLEKTNKKIIELFSDDNSIDVVKKEFVKTFDLVIDVSSLFEITDEAKKEMLNLFNE